KGAFRHKKVEWVIGYESDKQKVVYQFDGTKLERKANAAGKNSNISIVCKPPENAFQFLVTIEAASVTVTSPSCEKPDTYASPDHDLTKGKIGIKAFLFFVFRLPFFARIEAICVRIACGVVFSYNVNPSKSEYNVPSSCSSASTKNRSAAPPWL